uniref:type I polyketide synthase n=1 Tax=Streptomyces sporangiiformans TaxID=2315329 RepID=UPI001969749E
MGVQETLDAAGADALVLGSLRRDEGGLDRFVTSLAEGWVRGLPVDWQPLLAGGRRVDLPTYAFRRKHYWPAPVRHDGEPVAVAADPAEEKFWTAIEQEDLAEVAEILQVDGDQPLSSLMPRLSSWRRANRERSTVDSWRYRVTWERITEPTALALSGTWLVLVPESLADDEVVTGSLRALERGGAQVVRHTVDPRTLDRASAAELLREASRAVGVWSLLALDGGQHTAYPAVPAGVAGTLLVLQALGDLGADVPMWCATRGAVAAGPGDTVTHPAQALVWGMGRVAGLECTGRWGGLVDLPATADERALGRLGRVLAAGTGEDQLALRATGAFGRRIERDPVGDETANGMPDSGRWRPRGTVLVTGGTGALGGHIARWLAAEGAEHLLLTSRRGADAPGADDLRAELMALGARVTLAACDVSDRAALAELLDQHPVDAVVHTAAVLDDTALDLLDLEQVEQVQRVKVQAAQHLHELTRDRELSAFILFSSLAGTLGASGQGNYAPGNAFLDALAQHRRAQGLTATSVAWGPWADGGMAESGIGEVARRHGVPEMAPGLAVAALRQALDRDETYVTVADIDWQRFHAAYTASRPTRFFDALDDARRIVAATGTSTREQDADDTPTGLAQRLAGLARAEQEALLLDLVRTHVAAVLGYSADETADERRPFRDLGFDSVTAVQLRNRLRAVTGLKLPATLVFDHPTPTALVDLLRAELVGAGAPAEQAPLALTGPRFTGGADGAEDPIAIVAMSCRFPGGVPSPDDLWQMLVAERDAVTGLPTDRGWDLDGLYDPDPDHPGTSYTTAGSFLHDAARFDPALFGISPREALAMDPQQRLVLEAAWEVFERAGIDPTSLRGTPAGVFVGSYPQGYSASVAQAPEEIEGYLVTGDAASVMSGRIAYTFGLEGPAMTVDTACSSSLVALHLAVQALRNGECTLALAGGVTVMATTATFSEFSRQRGLAADGRCKPFAEAADGFGQGEGVGMLLVERLSDARRNGHQVLALVRGSAVNQDGASNGLTAPNGPSQQRVIRQALADARLAPADVDAVEAHGTGTTLGDPIEAQALIATYGQERDADRPLWLGSIKSNIGHAQAAAGVAGVIKMVLAMRHGLLPRSLHIDAPSSRVEWSDGAVELLTSATPWPENGHPRRAGVSSFGFSGTNAHVVLEQAPEPPAPSADDTPGMTAPTEQQSDHGVVPLVLSAQTGNALRAQAARVRRHLEDHPELAPRDIGWSLIGTRAALDHRAVVVGPDRPTLLGALDALSEGRSDAALTEGVLGAGRGKVAFVFPGQGSQWVGMATELIESSPVFAERMRECAAALSSYVEWSLFDVLEDAEALERVDVVQPVLWAVMVSLAELWRSYGVRPAAVVGHSQGEIAAACVAGALSIDDAARVVALRSKAILALSGLGGMVSVALPVEEVRERLSEGLSVAAVNGPSSVVVSGDVAELDALLAACEAEEVRARRIPVDYASHSAHVEAIHAELLDVLTGLEPRTAEVPFFSTVTADWLDTSVMDAEYWYSNLRQTVRFEEATKCLVEQGHQVFIEASPHPVLTVGLRETLDELDSAGVAIGTLRRGEGGPCRFLLSLGEVHTHGVRVDWTPVFAGARQVALPTYAFDHQRFWLVEEGVSPGEVGGVVADPLDVEFWATVEREDSVSLAETLGLEGDELGVVLPALSSWRRRHKARSRVDEWRYSVSWKPVTLESRALAGCWLVVSADAEQDVLSDVLEGQGTEVQRLVLEGAVLSRAGLVERLSGVGAVDGVVSLLGLREAGFADTMTLTQALGDAGVEAPLWLVTRGAVSVGRSDRLTAPVQAQLWGFGRVVGLEHPDRWGGLVDLPEALDERAGARLAAVLAGVGGDEDQLAVRGSGVFVRRLVRAPLGDVPAVRSWSPRGTVLITGGTGALGAHVARWAAANGAEHLVLTSRRGQDAPGALGLAAELGEFGARVTVAACDVADREALAGLLAEHPPTAVVHAAGTVHNSTLDTLTDDAAAAVLAPKVSGARNLDELLGETELDAFVLFSSNAGVWGSGGQSTYAAGNAYLDALAEDRRARGLSATSIAWGAWGGGGLAAEAAAEEQLRRRGVLPMEPDLALSALVQAVEHDETFVAVADVDWARFVPGFTAARPRPLISDIPEVRRVLAASNSGDVPGDEAPDLVRTLAAASETERTRALLQLVREEAATVLGLANADAIDRTKAFRELGFDSLTAVQMRDALGRRIGVRLPATVVFDHPTAAALTEHLRGEILGADAAPTAPRAVAAVAVASDEPIAIVGMACRYPGDARSPEQLWDLVASGTDAMAEFPTDRGWDVDGDFSSVGGFVYDAGEFDAGFFGISPREALAMDPQQRLMLEAAWELFERAGIDPTSLRGSQTGVFAGASSQGYGTGLSQAAGEGYLTTGDAGSVVSGRLSYVLGLEGPAVTVDTACSS